ncbi:hypothetical protein A9Z42_0049220 [Trichoderma parareesei]|uniref:HNH nuclease domain-containing protein n=1 Tax=Trichoderma parareesei TaxID=858221 RepID=A0A2H2ZAK9_TRIPA|nr:hypothetical protein A9Z42_0049220 [Trichoderma parareesei]
MPVFRNPLKQLAFVTENPARNSPVSDELSSAWSDPESQATYREEALGILASYQPRGPKDDTAAILRIFLERLPQEGQMALVSDIKISIDHSELHTLRNHLVDAILKPMKLAGGKQPDPITQPSNPAAVEQIDLSMIELDPAQREQGRIKEGCLRRDGYRCLVTGSYDLRSLRERRIVPPTGASRAITQCAHILPFGLSSFDEADAVATKNKAIIWYALHRYFPALRGKMDTDSVNQYGNLMTLESNAHFALGDFSLAFRPMDKDNVYKVCAFDLLPSSIQDGQLVEFVAHDRFPLPDRDILKVHCRIAEILSDAELIGAKI